MNEQFVIYLWSISESVKAFVSVLATMTLFAGPFIVSYIWENESNKNPYQRCTEEFENHEEKIKKKAWHRIIVCVIISFILGLTAILIPSKKDLALILAYPYLKSSTEHTIQSGPIKKITKIANKYLDKIMLGLEE